MKTISYRLTLKEPAILTSIQGEPNSSVSYDFIPGSIIRGLCIGAKTPRNGELDLSDEQTLRLFFSNDTRYLNAYPVIKDQRSLPVPVSWQKSKYVHSDIVTDSALSEPSNEKNEKSEGIKGYAVIKGDAVYLFNPRRIINIHTQRARHTPAEQLVYRYDALAPDQTFEGRILCHDDDVDLLLNHLNKKSLVHVGGARNAGYGSACIHDVKLVGDWQEVDHNINIKTMTITFLSDAILRDNQGEYSPTITGIKKALSQYNIEFSITDEQQKNLNLQTTLVGGFNRKWGLPLPQTVAIKRGSVMQITVTQGDEESFKELLRQGIGERTNEGFGQLAINWQEKPTLKVSAESNNVIDKISEFVRPDKGDAKAALDRFEERQQLIQSNPDHIKTIFTDERYKISGRITPSQLSRLRTEIADELRNPNVSLDVINTFLDDVTGKQSAEQRGKSAKMKASGKQFEQSRIKGKSLLDWLCNPEFHFFTDDSDKRQQLRLIDAVLERAHKEQTHKKKAGEEQ